MNLTNPQNKDMIKKFNKPTVEVIINYLTDEKNYDDFTAAGFAEKFWHYYESKGWAIGKSPMKNWKAAIRTWEIKNKEYETNRGGFKSDSKQGTSTARIEALRRW